MADIRVLEKRETHGYKPNWAHLDRWNPDDTITVKILPGRYYTRWEQLQLEGKDPEKEYIDGCEAGTTVYTVVVKSPKNLPRRDFLQRMSDYMDRGGCDCPGDCCGCVSSHVCWSTAKKVRRNTWRIEVNHSRNL